MWLGFSVPVALMSIRAKILMGCLALTTLTAALGAYSQIAQRQLAGLATTIYDDAFMGVSYLRSAQVHFGELSRQTGLGQTGLGQTGLGQTGLGQTGEAGLDQPAVAAILDDLSVASERAMSAAGKQEVDALRSRIAAASTGDLASIQGEFEGVVEAFADDGFRYRHSVGKIVAAQARRTWIAIIGLLSAAVVITVIVASLIAPPIRRAVRIAQAIADGRLDNEIAVSGQGETADLLRALAVMQGNIAAAMGRIHRLMADQATNHQSELVAQHAKLEAALENMNQGLCLFDSNDRLVVANRRFAELFGAPELGASAAAVLNSSGLVGLMKLSQADTAAVFSCSLPDGRNIAVTQRPIRAGGWVATYEDTTERRAAEARLTHMAQHDQLTGLANRAVFQEHMRRVLGHAPADSAVAVLCLDLDRFKAVNDALGHAAGDTVLRTVAQRLRECTRDTDLIVRIGGDEFVIVQAAANQPAAATALAHRLVVALSQPVDLDQQQVVIGTSIGVAVSEAASDTAETLLRAADIALYRAKADGRGTIRFFEAAMDVLVQARRKLELELRNALALKQFELFYQPLVNAEQGGIEGFEALVRWRHPDRGLVSPTAFIPVAEEIGLIGPLGEWVISKACFDAAKWPGSLKVAVNLSPAQFRHRSIAEHVQAALELSGLPAGRLELEITESVLLQDDADVMKTLFALRALGVRISMDDFGTGYSSLSYLRRFPFDKIKIDQSFVQGMVKHEDCRAIVRAVIGLGQSLKIAVNAEGVETAEQWDALRAEGCDQVQGFLFSKPRPGDDVLGMLAEHGNATIVPAERAAQARHIGSA